MDYPQAKQSLSSKGITVREAPCPLHPPKTVKSIGCRQFMGPQKDNEGHLVWAFKCKEKGGHIFIAEPDPTAPKTLKQVEGWKKRQ